MKIKTGTIISIIVAVCLIVLLFIVLYPGIVMAIESCRTQNGNQDSCTVGAETGTYVEHIEIIPYADEYNNEMLLIWFVNHDIYCVVSRDKLSYCLASNGISFCDWLYYVLGQRQQPNNTKTAGFGQ